MKMRYNAFMNRSICTSVSSVGSEKRAEEHIRKLHQGIKKAQKEKAGIEEELINHEELKKNHSQLDGLQKQVS